MEAGQRIPVGGDTPRVAQTTDSNGRQASSATPTFSLNRKSAVPAQGQTQRSQSVDKKEGVTSRFLDGVISVSLVAMFFGLPIFFTGLTLQGLAFEKQMYFYFWLLLGIVSWVSRGVITGEMRIRKTPLDIPIALFAVAYIASAFGSIDRWHSFWGAFGDPTRGILNMFALIAAYYLILSHFTMKRAYMMLAALLSSACVMMVWTFLIANGIRFLPSSLELRSPLSVLGSISSLTLFLGGMLPIFIATISLVQAKNFGGSLVKNLCTTLLVIAIVADLFMLFAFFPYVSWLAVIGGFSFFLIYVLAQVVKIEERWMWLPMLTLVVLLAFYMIGSSAGENFQKIFPANLPMEATPGTKISWEISKAALSDRSFFGSGPATYGYDFSLYRSQEYNMDLLSALRISQGKGLYFEALPTIGVVGTIAFTILLLSFLSVGIYLLAQKKDSDKSVSLGLWGAVIVLFIGALSTQFNGSILIIGTLVAAFSLAVLMKESRSEESYLTLSFQASPKFALALAFVFLVVSAGVAFTFVFIGKAFWSDVLAARAMESKIGDVSGIDNMSKASRFMPNESRYKSYLGQIYLTMATQEVIKDKKEQSALTEYVNRSKSSAIAGSALSPNDVVAQEMLAQTYEGILSMPGMMDRAYLEDVRTAYERASALEPHNPVYYMKLGQIKRALANSAKEDEQKVLLAAAKDLFQKSIDEKSNFVPGYFNLGLAQESMGDVDAAVGSLVSGILIDRASNDADELKYNLARILRIRGKEEDMKTSEALLKEILAKNDTSLNAHLTLGLIYEQTGRKSDAIQSYEKILSLLQGNDIESAKKQVQKLIDNVKAGKSNAIESSATDLPQQASADNSAQNVTPAAPATDAAAPQGSEAPIQ